MLRFFLSRAEERNLAVRKIIHCRRNKRGASIAEFAPALYVILLLGFFPMLDMLGIVLSYADCQYLHHLLLRQAAVEDILTLDSSVTPPQLALNTTFVTDPNGSFHRIVKTWYNGFGHYSTDSYGNIAVTLNVDLAEGNAKLKYVQVTLAVKCKPLVPVPFFMVVPGLNAPETFRISGTAVIENVPS